MAEKDKKFYWIKLRQSLLTSEKVDFLMSQKNGAYYVVLYQCLCLKTINSAGELANKVGELIIPFDEQKIERECKWFDIDTIRVAMSLYKKLGLIYEQENGILKITDFEDLVGGETYWAEKKRLQRDKNKEIGQPLDNVQHTLISNIYDSNIYYNTLLSYLEVDCNVIYKRHQYKVNAENNLTCVGNIMSMLDEIHERYSLEEIRERFRNANKDYPVQPKYKNCDFEWLLNNLEKFKTVSVPESQGINDIDFLIAKGFSKEWVMALSEEERAEKRKKWE
jgi:hypothetical protein